MNNNDKKNNRIFIEPDDFIITDMKNDTHSLTNEEVKEKLEKRKEESLKQFESMFGSDGQQSDEDDIDGLRRG